jgi:hypothetical protein
MSNELLELFCHILGDSSDRIFPIKIASTESVGELKKEIKAQKSLTLKLTLSTFTKSPYRSKTLTPKWPTLVPPRR